MPLTVGTAGHVDHGKTWLVRALTGKDTDRLRQERERGISIELGYAPLALPDGRTVSLVDVPGHERFVRTMVAGATGIDLFLLVVDANEGARPQTHEHLAILRLLGIDRGVVAVTKADAVEAGALELARSEAAELVPGAPVVAVSARTGSGVDDLRAALGRAAERVDRSREVQARARLYVDRVFTLRGIGTVVTGTLWSGSVGRGDRLLVEPAGVEARVRSVQVHDRDVERADAGQRVALNLTGVDRTRITRGSAIVEPGAFPRSYRLDVALEPTGEIPAAVTLHHGTSQIPARVHRREDGSAQLRLAAPIVAAAGDRFVLRTDTTVGGGVVLDPAPARTPSRQISEPVAAPPPPRPVTVDAQAATEADASLEVAGYEPLAVDRAIAEHLEREGRAVRVGDGLAVGRAAYDRARAIAVEECERAGSITLARFRDLLGTSRRPAQLLLERFDADGVTRRVGDARVLRRSARQ